MENIAIELEALERVFSDQSAEPIKLSYRLLSYVTDNFSDQIGCGGFGVVYAGYFGNGKVAVKKLSSPHALPDEKFMDEIRCLKMAKHKNIVRILGYCSETQGELLQFEGRNVIAEVQQKLLCFEYVPNGNIQDYLKKEKPEGDDLNVRYKMIKGICQGLHHLHQKHITHLDLKPENVMLDAQMEPKVTDFGISRCFDEGQSKVITKNIVGTRRYIAPETIDRGEISFKSDIYALGIIIIELLTGINKINLENWDESLDMECPQVRRCSEIARNCMDPDKHNRPAVSEIICDLDELDGMISSSSENQITTLVFPGNELLDVYPLELTSPFVPNEKMHFHLSLTNKQTMDWVYYVIIPQDPDSSSFKEYYAGFVQPLSTAAITLSWKAEEELPSYMDTLEIIVFSLVSDKDTFEKQLEELSLNSDTPIREIIKAIEELWGLEVHRTTLKAAVVASELECYRAHEINTRRKEEEEEEEEEDGKEHNDEEEDDGEKILISCEAVHPTEPLVLIIDNIHAHYIWNWETNERIKARWDASRPKGTVAKFIARKQWVVTGYSNGSIIVHKCPTMDQLKEFKAHNDCVTSLDVHPTRPFLLSFSYPLSVRLWDWNRNWSCTGVFDITRPLNQVMFNPVHTSTFSTLSEDGTVKMWRIGHPNPIATMEAPEHKDEDRDGDSDIDNNYEGSLLTCSGYRQFSAAIGSRKIYIWDWQKEKRVHTLAIRGKGKRTAFIGSHPTRPILVTISIDGIIRLWDSTTYRIKKAYCYSSSNSIIVIAAGSRVENFDNIPLDQTRVGFTGSRLVIRFPYGIVVTDIDLELKDA